MMNRPLLGQGSAEVHEGAILGGRYRIEGEFDLETGEVSVAPGVDLATGLVSIRVVRLAPGQDAAGALAVARAAMELRSERVERVLGVGEIDARTIYLVTEAREGVDLATLVAREGPLPISLAISLVAEACEALADAHAQSIYHGGLSPESLFAVPSLDSALSIKVTGFGEPRDAGDARGDIWSLGAVLFYLLTGVPPPPSPELRALRPRVPVALERVVLRCLEPEPRARYASVAELSRALAVFLPEEEIAPRSVRLRPAWIRAVAVLSIIGFAAFAGLAFSAARPADLATAWRPFHALLEPTR